MISGSITGAVNMTDDIGSNLYTVCSEAKKKKKRKQKTAYKLYGFQHNISLGNVGWHISGVPNLSFMLMLSVFKSFNLSILLLFKAMHTVCIMLYRSNGCIPMEKICLYCASNDLNLHQRS